MFLNIEDLAFGSFCLLRLYFERNIVSIDILKVLVLFQNELRQLILKRFATVPIIFLILHLVKSAFLFFVVIFPLSSFWSSLFWL